MRTVNITILLTLWALLHLPAYAQRTEETTDSVVVLIGADERMVTPEGGVRLPRVREAVEFVTALLEGSVDPENDIKWEVRFVEDHISEQVLGRADEPLLRSGGRILFGRFGDPDVSTGDLESVDIGQLKALGKSLPSSSFKSSSVSPELAQAHVWKEAEADGLISYILVEIGVMDGDVASSLPSKYKRMIEGFNEQKEEGTHAKIASFVHRETDGKAPLEIAIYRVDLRRQLPLITDLQVPRDVSVGDDSDVTWSTVNLPDDIVFQVKLSQAGKGGVTQQTGRPEVAFLQIAEGKHIVSVTIPDSDAREMIGVLSAPGLEALPPRRPLEVVVPKEGEVLVGGAKVLVEGSGEPASIVITTAKSGEQIVSEMVDAGKEKEFDLPEGSYFLSAAPEDGASRMSSVVAFSVGVADDDDSGKAIVKPGSISILSPMPNEVVEPGIVSVSWQAKNLNKDANFRVMIYPVDGRSSVEPITHEVAGNRVSIPLDEGGDYEVRVLNLGGGAVVPATSKFSVKGGGGSDLMILLLLAAVAIGGFLFFKSRSGRDSSKSSDVEMLD